MQIYVCLYIYVYIHTAYVNTFENLCFVYFILSEKYNGGYFWQWFAVF